MILITFQPAGELESRPGSLGFVLSLLPASPIHDGHGNLQLFSRQAVRPPQSIVCIAKFTGMDIHITLVIQYSVIANDESLLELIAKASVWFDM